MNDIAARSREYIKRLEESANYLLSLKRKASIVIVLGSGLGQLAEELEESMHIPYSEIPNFPLSTAPDHSGNLVYGKLADIDVALCQGRAHCHEGYSPQEAALPVRALFLSGIKNLIVTNAAGGINPDFHPGDIMFIKNHLSLFVEDPSLGLCHDCLGPRYYDTSFCYDQDICRHLLSFASGQKIRAHTGIYVMVKGPRYESAAEIKAFRTLGGDAVGMSTVPEVLAAKQIGYQRIVGISLISNQAAGISGKPISHQEVHEAAEAAKPKMSTLIKECAARIIQ